MKCPRCGEGVLISTGVDYMHCDSCVYNIATDHNSGMLTERDSYAEDLILDYLKDKEPLLPNDVFSYVKEQTGYGENLVRQAFWRLVAKQKIVYDVVSVRFVDEN